MRLIGLLASTTAMLATHAAADITADDVWANTTAMYQATGGTLDAEVTRDGSTVFVDDVRLTYEFPFDFGRITFGLPPMTMIEEDDGSVTQKLPKSFDVDFSVESEPAMIEDFRFSALVTQADFVSTATGTPGDITYERSAGAIGATVDLNIDFEDVTVSFEITGDGYSQTTRVQEGDLLRITSESETGDMRYSYQSDGGYDFSDEGSGEYGPTTGAFAAALPANGFDLINPAAAIQDGMFFDATTTQNGTRDESTTSFDGEVMTRTASSSGVGSSALRLSEDGFFVEAEVSDIQFMFEEREFIDLLADVNMNRMAVSYQVPLMARDTAQPVGLTLDMTGVVVNEELWDMADATGTISRDPINVALDIVSDVILEVDLLDFANLETAFDAPEPPFMPESLTINSLLIDAMGANATGTGAFEFDATDTETFDGLPRPEGDAEITIMGANALLDQLSAAGLVPDADLGGVRMMLGMFTRPAGDDTLTSTLAVNPEGQVLVNGERIR
ncbi:DUF2125 domain-containing protein [Yoonia sp. 2307UL14-13]|uniref:DUF2125 domain-containing protein n=1 Tax=Yoonia sp. 2307UL14-13 TaxID=3126506 RepID=UPI00309E5384